MQSDEMDDDEATELIFKLEKYGSGWGEELLPRLTVEQRPIKKRIRIRNRSSFPDAWQVRKEPWYCILIFLALQKAAFCNQHAQESLPPMHVLHVYKKLLHLHTWGRTAVVAAMSA